MERGPSSPPAPGPGPGVPCVPLAMSCEIPEKWESLQTAFPRTGKVPQSRAATTEVRRSLPESRSRRLGKTDDDL